VRIALNYATPFVVSNLGFVAARRRNIERLAAILIHDDKAEPETPTDDFLDTAYRACLSVVDG
jgi:hypothetical protein